MHLACRPNLRVLLPGLLAAASGMALAGRPLSVDDASTNDRGAGHVEAWVERASGVSAFTLAPAYAPFDGVELAAAFTRHSQPRVTAQALQLKWRITPAQDSGCNLGASAGVQRQGGGGGRSLFVNGLLSCHAGGLGSVHANLGWLRPSDADGVGSWGLAVERGYGVVTPHLEVFGERHAKPTVQIGARAEVAPGWQLDGSWGRQDGRSRFSLGLKASF